NRFAGGGILGSAVTIQGNFIGTNASGTTALGNGTPNFGTGIAVGSDSIVGGDSVGARNVVSGNFGFGVTVTGNSTIQGNFIGTDASGTVALGNVAGGIQFRTDPVIDNHCAIGGDAPEARNLISGNGGPGVSGVIGTGNLIQGNYIGTNVSGQA